jgi:hypothetical protein
MSLIIAKNCSGEVDGAWLDDNSESLFEQYPTYIQVDPGRYHVRWYLWNCRHGYGAGNTVEEARDIIIRPGQSWILDFETSADLRCHPRAVAYQTSEICKQLPEASECQYLRELQERRMPLQKHNSGSAVARMYQGEPKSRETVAFLFPKHRVDMPVYVASIDGRGVASNGVRLDQVLMFEVLPGRHRLQLLKPNRANAASYAVDIDTVPGGRYEFDMVDDSSRVSVVEIAHPAPPVLRE